MKATDLQSCRATELLSYGAEGQMSLEQELLDEQLAWLLLICCTSNL